MLFLLPTALLSFASQPGPNDCSVIQDTCDGCTETGPGDGFISFLNLEQFHSTYMSGGFDIVVDVRPAENYNDGHITGAYNHPGLAFLPSTDDLIPNLGDCKTKNVAVQCRTGNLARAAGRNLRARGFEKVYVLGENEGEPHACNSGFPDWQAAGYPTTDVALAWPAPQCFPENE